jgi:hypothetical protein
LEFDSLPSDLYLNQPANKHQQVVREDEGEKILNREKKEGYEHIMIFVEQKDEEHVKENLKNCRNRRSNLYLCHDSEVKEWIWSIL